MEANRLKNRRGLASWLLIVGLLMMAVALPAALRLAQKNQDVRNRATHMATDAGACAAGGGRWYDNKCELPTVTKPVVTETGGSSGGSGGGSSGGSGGPATSVTPVPTSSAVQAAVEEAKKYSTVAIGPGNRIYGMGSDGLWVDLTAKGCGPECMELPNAEKPDWYTEDSLTYKSTKQQAEAVIAVKEGKNTDPAAVEAVKKSQPLPAKTTGGCAGGYGEGEVAIGNVVNGADQIVRCEKKDGVLQWVPCDGKACVLTVVPLYVQQSKELTDKYIDQPKKIIDLVNKISSGDLSGLRDLCYAKEGSLCNSMSAEGLINFLPLLSEAEKLKVKDAYGENKAANGMMNGDLSLLKDRCVKKRGEQRWCDAMSVDDLIKEYLPDYEAAKIKEGYNKALRVNEAIAIGNKVMNGDISGLIEKCNREIGHNDCTYSVEQLIDMYLTDIDKEEIKSGYQQNLVLKKMQSEGSKVLYELCQQKGGGDVCDYQNVEGMIEKYLPNYADKAGEIAKSINVYEVTKADISLQTPVVNDLMRGNVDELYKLCQKANADNLEEYAACSSRTVDDLMATYLTKYTDKIGDIKKSYQVSVRANEYLTKRDAVFVYEACENKWVDCSDPSKVTVDWVLKQMGMSEEATKSLIAQKEAAEILTDYKYGGILPGSVFDYEETYEKALSECKSDDLKACQNQARKIADAAKEKSNGAISKLSTAVAEAQAVVNKCSELGGKDCSSVDASLNSLIAMTGNNKLTANDLVNQKIEIASELESRDKVMSHLKNLSEYQSREQAVASGATTWKEVNAAYEKVWNEGTWLNVGDYSTGGAGGGFGITLGEKPVMAWNDITSGRFYRGNQEYLAGLREGDFSKTVAGLAVYTGDAAGAAVAATGMVLAIPVTITAVGAATAVGAPMTAAGVIGSYLGSVSTAVGMAASNQMIGLAVDTCQRVGQDGITQRNCTDTTILAAVTVATVPLGILGQAKSAVQAGVAVGGLTKAAGTVAAGAKATTAMEVLNTAVSVAQTYTFSDMAIQTWSDPNASALSRASMTAMAITSGMGLVGNVAKLAGGVAGQGAAGNVLRAVGSMDRTTAVQATHATASLLFMVDACGSLGKELANKSVTADVSGMCLMGASGFLSATHSLIGTVATARAGAKNVTTDSGEVLAPEGGKFSSAREKEAVNAESLPKSEEARKPSEIDDFYERLGVKKDASQVEINEAYKNQAKKYHPDVNKAPDANLQMAKINEAYTNLFNSTKRANYDAKIANGSAKAPETAKTQEAPKTAQEAPKTAEPAAKAPETAKTQEAPKTAQEAPKKTLWERVTEVFTQKKTQEAPKTAEPVAKAPETAKTQEAPKTVQEAPKTAQEAPKKTLWERVTEVFTPKKTETVSTAKVETKNVLDSELKAAAEKVGVKTEGKKIADIEVEVEKAVTKKAIAELEGKVKAAGDDLTRLNKEMETRQDRLTEVQKEINKLSNAKVAEDPRMVAAKQRVSDIQNEIDGLQARIETLKKENVGTRSLEKQESDLKRDKGLAEENVGKVRKEISGERTAKISDLQSEKKTLSDELLELKAKVEIKESNFWQAGMERYRLKFELADSRNIGQKIQDFVDPKGASGRAEKRMSQKLSGYLDEYTVDGNSLAGEYKVALARVDSGGGVLSGFEVMVAKESNLADRISVLQTKLEELRSGKKWWQVGKNNEISRTERELNKLSGEWEAVVKERIQTQLAGRGIDAFPKTGETALQYSRRADELVRFKMDPGLEVKGKVLTEEERLIAETLSEEEVKGAVTQAEGLGVKVEGKTPEAVAEEVSTVEKGIIETKKAADSIKLETVDEAIKALDELVKESGLPLTRKEREGAREYEERIIEAMGSREKYLAAERARVDRGNVDSQGERLVNPNNVDGSLKPLDQYRAEVTQARKIEAAKARYGENLMKAKLEYGQQMIDFKLKRSEVSAENVALKGKIDSEFVAAVRRAQRQFDIETGAMKEMEEMAKANGLGDMRPNSVETAAEYGDRLAEAFVKRGDSEAMAIVKAVRTSGGTNLDVVIEKAKTLAERAKELGTKRISGETDSQLAERLARYEEAEARWTEEGYTREEGESFGDYFTRVSKTKKNKLIGFDKAIETKNNEIGLIEKEIASKEGQLEALQKGGNEKENQPEVKALGDELSRLQESLERKDKELSLLIDQRDGYITQLQPDVDFSQAEANRQNLAWYEREIKKLERAIEIDEGVLRESLPLIKNEEPIADLQFGIDQNKRRLEMLKKQKTAFEDSIADRETQKAIVVYERGWMTLKGDSPIVVEGEVIDGEWRVVEQPKAIVPVEEKNKAIVVAEEKNKAIVPVEEKNKAIVVAEEKNKAIVPVEEKSTVSEAPKWWPKWIPWVPWWPWARLIPTTTPATVTKVPMLVSPVVSVSLPSVALPSTVLPEISAAIPSQQKINPKESPIISMTSNPPISGEQPISPGGKEPGDEGGGLILRFKVAFDQIVSDAKCLDNWPLKITMMGRKQTKTYNNVIPKLTDKKNKAGYPIFEGMLVLTGFIDRDGVSALIKGPKHLQMKYAIDKQEGPYNKEYGELVLSNSASSSLVQDFSNYEMMPGDVTGENGTPDGWVNGIDFSYIKARSDHRGVEAPSDWIADLDGNCQINANDINVLKITLKEKQSELY